MPMLLRLFSPKYSRTECGMLIAAVDWLQHPPLAPATLLADRELPLLLAALEVMAPDWLPENIHSPALLVCGVAVTV